MKDESRPARSYTRGDVEGVAFVLAAPVSFWGGVDVETGRLIDHSHPDLGRSITGTILVMQGGRGSSSSSSVLAETIRRGTCPLGIVLATPDSILTVGALVAESLYGKLCPIVVCDIDGIRTGSRMRIMPSSITVRSPD